MELVNMKRDPKPATDGAIAAPYEESVYPYGLELSLDDEQLTKLGMTLPAVGAEFTLIAMVKVTRASSHEDTNGTDKSTSLQITDMQLTPNSAVDAATALWPG